MIQRWDFGNGDRVRTRGKDPEDIPTSVRLPLSPTPLLVLWFPSSRTSQVLADTVIQTLFIVKERWEAFFRRHPQKKKMGEVGLFCDGLDHARKVGFKEEWDFEKDPVTCTFHYKDKGSVILSAVLTEKYVEFEPAAIATSLLVRLVSEFLSRGSGVRKPGPVASRFVSSVEEEIEELFE